MSYTLLFDNTTNAGATALGGQSGIKTYRGQRFDTGHDVIGNTVNKVEINLAKYQSAAIVGTFYCVVVKSDLTEIEIGSLDVSTLSDTQPTYTEYTFTNDSNNYVMTDADMVCCKYLNNNGGAAIYLSCQYSTNEPANSNYVEHPSGGTFEYPTTWSQPMKVYSLDAAPPTSSGTFLPPPPAMVRL